MDPHTTRNPNQILSNCSGPTRFESHKVWLLNFRMIFKALAASQPTGSRDHTPESNCLDGGNQEFGFGPNQHKELPIFLCPQSTTESQENTQPLPNNAEVPPNHYQPRRVRHQSPPLFCSPKRKKLKSF